MFIGVQEEGLNADDYAVSYPSPFQGEGGGGKHLQYHTLIMVPIHSVMVKSYLVLFVPQYLQFFGNLLSIPVVFRMFTVIFLLTDRMGRYHS